ncbi:hypothetical protein [Paraburkholderia dilworthii]|uniref:hypothetical protein n=1 Tax=Paraburkholderia dilworthii TaxID=948106 RepID=UPI0005603243|nr:hypothetical protein [Paraburkholderia dilworthii]
MKTHSGLQDLSLLGGPLHRLGCRLHLVHGRSNTTALGVALGLLLWGILMALAFIEGMDYWMSSPLVVGVHVRLLVAIPLLFVCESLFDPCVTSFVRSLTRSGLVPTNSLQEFEGKISQLTRWKDAWLPEVICALLAAILWWYGTQLTRFGTTADYMTGRPATGATMTGQWYWTVCLTVFRFLILRWVWRLALWWYFLATLSLLPLRLIPVHPDGAAGLGYLGVVHAHFAPLVLAISASQTASFVEGFSAGTMPITAIYPAVSVTLLVDALLFVVPLLVFSPKLWACRLKGLDDYMRLAARYANLFDKKWAGTRVAADDQLLATPDFGTLVALRLVVAAAGDVRWIPASPRLLAQLTLAALLPMAPLLLLKYPVAELLQKFIERLSGI